MSTAIEGDASIAVEASDPLWQSDCEMVQKILEFAWIIQRDAAFEHWDWFERRDKRKRQSPLGTMPSSVGKIIFGTGHSSYWSNFRQGKGWPNAYRDSAAPGARLLRHFFSKRLTDVGGTRLELAFDDDEEAQSRLMARCYFLMDENEVLTQEILLLLDDAFQMMGGLSPKRDRTLSPDASPDLSNQLWATPLWEGDFTPDANATRRFLRGREPDLRSIREGTVPRPELEIALAAIRDGKELLLIDGWIASGRSTLLRQIAMHLVDQGRLHVYLVQGAEQLGIILRKLLAKSDNAQAAILCDDVHWPTTVTPYANMLAGMTDWLAIPAFQRPLIVGTVRRRYLPEAKHILHWMDRNIDANAHAQARQEIHLSSNIDWEEIAPLLRRFAALDSGVNIEQAKDEFQRYAERGPWIANYAATRAVGLSERFGRLVDEASAEGWLAVLAAIVTVNRNVSYRPANDERRWLEQPWREAIEWLLQPELLSKHPELIAVDAPRSEMPGLSSVINTHMSGELICPEGTGETATHVSLRHPIITQILDEKIFGWTARSEYPEVGFRAKKLEWIIDLACFLASRRPSAAGVGRQSADLIWSQNHFIAEHKSGRHDQTIQGAHIDQQYPNYASLHLKFADKVAAASDENQLQTTNSISGRASYEADS